MALFAGGCIRRVMAELAVRQRVLYRARWDLRTRPQPAAGASHAVDWALCDGEYSTCAKCELSAALQPCPRAQTGDQNFGWQQAWIEIAVRGMILSVDQICSTMVVGVSLTRNLEQDILGPLYPTPPETRQ